MWARRSRPSGWWIAELYPTKADYLEAYRAAASDAVAAGFLLEVDADAMVTSADADYPG